MIDEAHRAFAEPTPVRTGKTIGTLVQSALAGRRTVRITYHRNDDSFNLDVVQGEWVIDCLCRVVPSDRWNLEDVEAYVEREAASAARCRGLDVSRVDVP
jgi:hypothetical protein